MIAHLPGRLGRRMRVRGLWWAGLFEMGLRVSKAVWRHRRRGRLVVRHAIHKQVLFTGVHAFWLIAQVAVLMGLALGLVITVLANAELTGAVQESLSRQFTPLVQLLAIEFATTTISPLLITLIVTARSGTAIASELSLMRIRGETSALQAMGIDLDHYIVWPRIVGMVVSTICLVVFFNFLLIAVHFLVVNAFAISETVRSLAQIERASQLVNLLQAVLKSALIGAGIALIGCAHGLQARQSYTEVPQASTRAVMSGVIFSVLANVGIFVLFYLFFGFAALQG